MKQNVGTLRLNNVENTRLLGDKQEHIFNLPYLTGFDEATSKNEFDETHLDGVPP